MNDPALVQVMLLNTMGLSVLTQTLKAASHFIYLKATDGRSDTAQCYVFIQGTGLDALIARYDLGYDAEELRQSFNYYLLRKKNDLAGGAAK